MNKRIIHTVFEAQVEKYPEHHAVEEEGQSVTYRDLNTQANSLAHVLRYLGAGKDKVTAVCLPPGISLATSLLAVFKSGGIYLPMDKVLPVKKLVHMLQQTEAGILIASLEAMPLITELSAQEGVNLKHVVLFDEFLSWSLYTVIDGGLRQAEKPEVAGVISNPDLLTEPSDSNYIFYTSGSTGEAKAILGCHDSLSHFIHWEGKEFAIDGNSRISQLSQVTFDASLRDILLPLSTGGTLCVPDAATKSNIPQLVRWVADKGITLVHCVPSLFRLISRELLAEPKLKESFRTVKYILMAGEPLYGKDVQLWQESGASWVELVNLYGTSETTLVKTFHRIADIPADPSLVLHVGKPISNAGVLILSGTMLCEAGMIGEVYIRTPFMTKGYFKDETLTQKSFVPNPLVTDRIELMHKTGDMGRYLPGGNIEILGRLDEQVKVNGIRVELNEIRQAVLSLEGIREVVIQAHKNGDMQVELLCYYIGPGITADNLRTHLQKELSEQVIPPYIMPMDEFPLTINGKIDKRALPKPEFLLIDKAAYEPVINATEAQLEQIWKEVLGLNMIGRKAAFFKIGGTSLKAMQVISKVYRVLDITLKLGDVFQHPTIEDLARLMDTTNKSAYTAIPRLPQQEFYEVSNAQKRIWLEHRLEAGKSRFNMPSAFLLRGKVDAPVMAKAFESLVTRHESLRTVFVDDSGIVKQQIKSTEDSGFRFELLDNLQGQDIRKKVEELSTGPFDLEKGPLIRVHLLILPDNEAVLLFNTHHIISDGWSEEVLIREALNLYENYMQDNPVMQAPLTIQYKDYAAWLNKQLGSALYFQQEQYWKNRLSGPLPVLLFPTDYPRPDTRSGQGDILEFFIENELTAMIQEYAAARETSMFIVLTTITKVLLHKYTGQEDLLIGTPIAGRTHPDLQNQVGLYLNLLVLRTQFRATNSFDQVLAQVKETVVTAFENQLYPFDDLINTIGIIPEPGRTPVADVWVQWSDEVFDFGKNFAGLTIDQFEMGYSTSKVDLTFKFTMRGTRLHIAIEYSTDLFSRTTIEMIQRNFILLLEQLPHASEQPIAALELMLSESAEAEEAEFLKNIYG